MSTTTRLTAPEEIEYPESDGELMAENTEQYRWITLIEEGLEDVFRDAPDVFVAADLFWYPVRGNKDIRRAPDVMVAFGRPKGRRSSYLQWREGGIAPQVVFEILSPSNRGGEMALKFQFYETHGVEEYYIYDPDEHTLEGWIRAGDTLRQIPAMNGWTSPRLGVRFEWVDEQFRLYGPDSRPFVSALESKRWADAQTRRADEHERRADEQERQTAEQRRRADEHERQTAEQRRRADEQERQAEEQRRLVARLAAQLRALGIEPETESGGSSPWETRGNADEADSHGAACSGQAARTPPRSPPLASPATSPENNQSRQTYSRRMGPDDRQRPGPALRLPADPRQVGFGEQALERFLTPVDADQPLGQRSGEALQRYDHASEDDLGNDRDRHQGRRDFLGSCHRRDQEPDRRPGRRQRAESEPLQGQ